MYSGPVIGQARAVVDCVPSPYDKDALTFDRDDLIDIFDMISVDGVTRKLDISGGQKILSPKKFLV